MKPTKASNLQIQSVIVPEGGDHVYCPFCETKVTAKGLWIKDPCKHYQDLEKSYDYGRIINFRKQGK